MKFEESNVKSFQQLIKTPRKSVIARSEKQSEYIKALKENDIVMSLGPAGTGKSFLAVSVAVTLLMEKKVDRVILSRPAVEAGEKLGFLPGDMKEKVDPYLRPLYDALYELFGSDKIISSFSIIFVKKYLFIKNFIASQNTDKFSLFPLQVIEFPLKKTIVLVNFSNSFKF